MSGCVFLTYNLDARELNWSVSDETKFLNISVGSRTSLHQSIPSGSTVRTVSWHKLEKSQLQQLLKRCICIQSDKSSVCFIALKSSNLTRFLWIHRKLLSLDEIFQIFTWLCDLLQTVVNVIQTVGTNARNMLRR